MLLQSLNQINDFMFMMRLACQDNDLNYWWLLATKIVYKVLRQTTQDDLVGQGSVRPNLTKFYRFGNILRVLLAIGKILNLLWEFFYPIGLIYIVGDGQILNKQSTHLVTLPRIQQCTEVICSVTIFGKTMPLSNLSNFFGFHLVFGKIINPPGHTGQCHGHE